VNNIWCDSLSAVEGFGNLNTVSLARLEPENAPTTPLPKPVPKLRCELITQFEKLEQLSGDWDRLWRSDPTAEIFQSFTWARAWWRAYGRHYALHSLAVYADDTVIGILPLVRNQQSLQFLGSPQADYNDVICEEARAAEVLTAAFLALYNSDQWQECKLEHLPQHSRVARYWRYSAHGFRRYVCLVFGYYCQTIIVPPDDPDLLSKIACKKKMHRHLNKFAKLGVAKFRFLNTKFEAQQHLPQFFQYHARRRILIGERSGCHQPEFQGLLEGLVDQLDLKDALRFGVIEVNGNPVAYHFGFETAGKFTLYQQAFDVNAWDYHPGNVLLHHMLLYASEKGAREFDFTIGVEPYKTRYTNCVKQTLTFYLEPHTLGGLVRRLRHSLGGHLYQKAVDVRTRFQQYPKIYGPIDALRKWVLDSPSESPEQSQLKKRPGSWLARMGALIWQKQNQIIFRLERDSRKLDGGNQPNIETAPARLGDIADLLLENHDFPGDLSDWRGRIARGDQLIIVREDGKATLALWTTNDPTVILSPSKKHAINFDSARIVYEQWLAFGVDISRAYAAALNYFVRQASKKENWWVCCPAGAGAQKQELISQSFCATHRLRNWRILHWLRFQQVRPCGADTLRKGDS
jgi:CelD/BcsL family acetyltransferase involved in cellulose biosynthesis